MKQRDLQALEEKARSIQRRRGLRGICDWLEELAGRWGFDGVAWVVLEGRNDADIKGPVGG